MCNYPKEDDKAERNDRSILSDTLPGTLHYSPVPGENPQTITSQKHPMNPIQIFPGAQHCRTPWKAGVRLPLRPHPPGVRDPAAAPSGAHGSAAPPRGRVACGPRAPPGALGLTGEPAGAARPSPHLLSPPGAAGVRGAEAARRPLGARRAGRARRGRSRGSGLRRRCVRFPHLWRRLSMRPPSPWQQPRPGRRGPGAAGLGPLMPPCLRRWPERRLPPCTATAPPRKSPPLRALPWGRGRGGARAEKWGGFSPRPGFPPRGQTITAFLRL